MRLLIHLGFGSYCIDLTIAALNLIHNNPDLHVLGRVVHQLALDAHPVESVGAWEDIELSIEDWLEADVAHLARVYRDMLVLLLPLLFSKGFCLF